MSAASATQLVYGPVPSRRLGRSLGVDLVPFKACTYDCIYCQLGRTTKKTLRRQRWVDSAEVVAQVGARLASQPDVIALAGSGEPTLHAGIGEVIHGIKELTDVPVAVITNGSLLGLPAVRRGVAGADIVMPSLDASGEDLFQRVNRPHSALRFAEVLAGITSFRTHYRGEIRLEVMLLSGVTGTAAEVGRLAELAERIAPDRIQLNTAVRPPAESFAQPVRPELLREFACAFAPQAEVVAMTVPIGKGSEAGCAEVLERISRRPCTLTDITAGLGIHHGEALKAATMLVAEGKADLQAHDDRSFYSAASAAGNLGKEKQ